MLINQEIDTDRVLLKYWLGVGVSVDIQVVVMTDRTAGRSGSSASPIFANGAPHSLINISTVPKMISSGCRG